MTYFLTVEDLVAAASAALGDEDVLIGDHGLLAAAAARPAATVFGEDAYDGVDGKGAALLSSLVRNHALVDGNKRLGWVAVRLFYRLNDSDLRAPEDEAFDLIMRIADGTLVDVVQIAAFLKRWAVD